MSILQSGGKGEPSQGARSNVLAGEVEREAQAGSGPSTWSQAQVQKDDISESNSGEPYKISLCPSDLGI